MNTRYVPTGSPPIGNRLRAGTVPGRTSVRILKRNRTKSETPSGNHTKSPGINIDNCLYFNKEQADSIELSPNITAELNDRGELIGIEILNASTYLRDSVLGKTAENKAEQYI